MRHAPGFILFEAADIVCSASSINLSHFCKLIRFTGSPKTRQNARLREAASKEKIVCRNSRRTARLQKAQGCSTRVYGSVQTKKRFANFHVAPELRHRDRKLKGDIKAVPWSDPGRHDYALLRLIVAFVRYQ
jgi:hypothetical protein